jgi:predicted HD superfamily hydrolase involved in NAD metabolism
MPSTLVLPEPLQVRLNGLPQGLQDHIGRVRVIARELAVAHAVDQDLAELTAAAHDVARHIPGAQLIEEAERLGIVVHAVERSVPILLHGPVGAGWLAEEHEVDDQGVLEGVRWHTTAHPDLAPVGQIVFIADKLDPHKAKTYPFQAAVREAAIRSLEEGALTFLDGMLRQHVDRGDLIHPLCTDTRNALVLAAACC